MHKPDRLYQFVGGRALEKVPVSSRLESPLDLDVAFKRRKYDDAGVWGFRSDRQHCVDSAEVRKPQIHQCDIGLVSAMHLYGLSPVRCLGNEGHISLAFNDGGKPLAQEGMIVDTENADPDRLIHL